MDSEDDEPISTCKTPPSAPSAPALKPIGQYVGIIYKAVFCPPSPHPLEGCPYIGQSVKFDMSIHKVFKERCQNHVSRAKRDPRRHGFHALLLQYGIDAFRQWGIVEHKCGDRDQVQQWADEREKEHIRMNGGPLRSILRCIQTLNLTHGGKYHSKRQWKATDLLSAIAWDDFLRHLIQFKADYGHCMVPGRFHANDGYFLGSVVQNMRNRSIMIRGFPERRKTLETMGFTLKHPRTLGWERVYEQLVDFNSKFGHLDVPQHWISPSGCKLGKIVKNIRSHKSFLKDGNAACRFQMLRDIGFLWSSEHRDGKKRKALQLKPQEPSTKTWNRALDSDDEGE